MIHGSQRPGLDFTRRCVWPLVIRLPASQLRPEVRGPTTGGSAPRRLHYLCVPAGFCVPEAMFGFL